MVCFFCCVYCVCRCINYFCRNGLFTEACNCKWIFYFLCINLYSVNNVGFLLVQLLKHSYFIVLTESLWWQATWPQKFKACLHLSSCIRMTCCIQLSLSERVSNLTEFIMLSFNMIPTCLHGNTDIALTCKEPLSILHTIIGLIKGLKTEVTSCYAENEMVTIVL
jgi:hypothetical protein